MEAETIDVWEIVRKLWNRKSVILLFVLVLGTLSAGVAFMLPRQYKAQCTMGLELQDHSMKVKLEGLSTQQGMSLGDFSRSKVVEPSAYPSIFYSVPFVKELMYKPLFMGDGRDSLSLYGYFVNENKLDSEERSVLKANSVEQLTKTEEACRMFLKDRIELKLVTKDNYLKIIVRMPDANLAAQVAQQAELQLQRYITEFKVAKAQSSLDFIEERYNDIRQELEKRQQALLDLRGNKSVRGSVSQETEEKILTNDYELFFSLYADIMKQREKARILVKETMPILTVIEPVVVPSNPSEPRRSLIVLGGMLLGLFIGSCWVLIKPARKQPLS